MTPSKGCLDPPYHALMKLLLTNDDGIDAEGLQALLAAAREFCDPTLVAPDGPRSGCSHTVTSRLRVEPRGDGRFAVHGTPADCTRIGLSQLVPQAKWVLSGINHGGNLGADVYYSGTVAAVREAVLHGWPGIAFSHYKKKHLDYDWPRVSRWAGRVLADLLKRPIELGAFWSVNLPHLMPTDPEPKVVECPLDPHPLPLSYRHEEGMHHYDGDYHLRKRLPGGDVDVCFGGQIAVTRIRLL
jgi:5'-nucleotidase